METSPLKYPRRPFVGAHWALPVLLLSLWVLLFFSRQCDVEGARYPEVILATITTCIAFWTNHIRVGHIYGISKIATLVSSALYDLFLFLLLIVTSVIAVSIVMPTVNCNRSKANIYQLFGHADHVRAEINKRFVQQNTLNEIGVGLNLGFPERRAKDIGIVTSDGTIIMASQDPPATIVLQPVTGGKELTWKCLGFPTKYVSSSCQFAIPKSD